MDPLKNPYSPGAGSRPPALTGRDAELQAFRVLLARLRRGAPEKSMLVTGLRGVGKTVLLNAFRDVAESEHFRATDVTEITADTDFRQTMARLARRALRGLDPMENLKDKVLEAARVFKAFTLKLPGDLELEVDVEALRGHADTGNLTDDLGDLFVALGEAARARQTGILFLLDEVQFLKKEELSALIASLHRTTQRSLPITLVGAGLPQIPRLAGDAKSYAERLFNFPTIGRLDRDAAREALERPAVEQGGRFDVDAMDLVLDFTEGYPYFLQEYGKHLWNLSAGPQITRADAEKARTEVQLQLDEGFFRVRVARTTQTERSYLAAMASLGHGPYRTGEVADRLGKKSTSLSLVRDKLINKGLIYGPSHGLLDFTVPQFDDYLRRTQPFEGEARSGH